MYCCFISKKKCLLRVINICLNLVYFNTVPILYYFQDIYSENYFNSFLVQLDLSNWIAYSTQLLFTQILLFIIFLIRYQVRFSNQKSISSFWSKDTVILLFLSIFIVYYMSGILDTIFRNGLVEYFFSRFKQVEFGSNMFWSDIRGRYLQMLTPCICLLYLSTINKKICFIIIFIISMSLVFLSLKKYPILFFLLGVFIMTVRNKNLNLRKVLLTLFFFLITISTYLTFSYIQGKELKTFFDLASRILVTPHLSSLNKFYFVQVWGHIDTNLIKNENFLLYFTEKLYGVKFGDGGSFISISWLTGGWLSFFNTCFILVATLVLLNFLYINCHNMILKRFCFIIFLFSIFPLLSVDFRTWFSFYSIKWLILLLSFYFIFINFIRTIFISRQC